MLLRKYVLCNTAAHACAVSRTHWLMAASHDNDPL